MERPTRDALVGVSILRRFDPADGRETEESGRADAHDAAAHVVSGHARHLKHGGRVLSSSAGSHVVLFLRENRGTTTHSMP